MKDKYGNPLSSPVQASRRQVALGLFGLGAGGVVGLPALAALAPPRPVPILEGRDFDLHIGLKTVNVTGRLRQATVVNGSMPAPTLRFREGDVVTLNVTNHLREPTSLHWHGLRLPAAMDGVPGLTFAGIMPGESFTYRFPVRQSGTYWYHSHSGMQEQTGLFGALILDPATPPPYAYDRDHVILLSDWTDEDPMTVLANLKMQGGYYNYHEPTFGGFVADARRRGLGPAWRQSEMWGAMRMSPADIMDVNGSTYTFLINGLPPTANWTGLFAVGERVRLRVINGSAMTTFDLRIPGLKLTVVAADGSDIVPLEVDQVRLGVAETYDIIVQPSATEAYTLFAQAEDRSGYARATLAPRYGMVGDVPPLDPRPVRTMADMGMANMANMPGMAGMGMGDSGLGSLPVAKAAMAVMPAAPTPRPSLPPIDLGPVVQAPRLAPRPIPIENADQINPARLAGAINVDNVAVAPRDRLASPGDGLQDESRRTLVYADLKALKPARSERPVDRALAFHLTGNMQRWTWGFDGRKFSQASPIRVRLGECVRFVLINDTMMEHPIHLHGFLFSLENGNAEALPLKHTVNVKPGERVSFVFDADTPGHWAFHCHLMYHMETGMFRTVIVA